MEDHTATRGVVRHCRAQRRYKISQSTAGKIATVRRAFVVFIGCCRSVASEPHEFSYRLWRTRLPANWTIRLAIDCRLLVSFCSAHGGIARRGLGAYSTSSAPMRTIDACTHPPVGTRVRCNRVCMAVLRAHDAALPRVVLWALYGVQPCCVLLPVPIALAAQPCPARLRQNVCRLQTPRRCQLAEDKNAGSTLRPSKIRFPGCLSCTSSKSDLSDMRSLDLSDLDRLATESEPEPSTYVRVHQSQRLATVLSVRSSPSERIVASGHEDDAVRCWSGHDGRCL